MLNKPLQTMDSDSYTKDHNNILQPNQFGIESSSFITSQFLDVTDPLITISIVIYTHWCIVAEAQ